MRVEPVVSSADRRRRYLEYLRGLALSTGEQIRHAKSHDEVLRLLHLLVFGTLVAIDGVSGEVGPHLLDSYEGNAGADLVNVISGDLHGKWAGRYGLRDAGGTAAGCVHFPARLGHERAHVGVVSPLE